MSRSGYKHSLSHFWSIVSCMNATQGVLCLILKHAETQSRVTGLLHSPTLRKKQPSSYFSFQHPGITARLFIERYIRPFITSGTQIRFSIKMDNFLDYFSCHLLKKPTVRSSFAPERFLYSFADVVLIYILPIIQASQQESVTVNALGFHNPWYIHTMKCTWGKVSRLHFVLLLENKFAQFCPWLFITLSHPGITVWGAN